MAEVQLGSFLRRVAARPHVWGRTDCVMTLFEWVRLRTGIDPVAVSGAAWSCEREANAVIAGVGGVRDGGAELFRRCGLVETDAPAVGDIGVIEAMRKGQGMHVAAIFTGARWAFPAEPRGLAMARGNLLVAWSLGTI